METREIRILGFRYTDEAGNERLARKGQIVELSEEDAARGDADGCFVTDALEPLGTAKTPLDMSDDELEAYVHGARVKEVLAAAVTPELATRLLAAENAATGNEPRATLAEGLTAIVGAV